MTPQFAQTSGTTTVRPLTSSRSRVVEFSRELGSGGKESVEATIRNLSPIIAYADKVTGAKEVRAEPFCAAVQNGDVSLCAGEWVMAFRDEAEAWPNSRYKDQIDAAAGAFAKLAATTAYDTSYAAFDPYYQDR
jgi:predicted phage terminase large subunit-like protein